MKQLTKRISLVTGLLLTALICAGFVYVDNLKHYFYASGGFVQFWVNTNFVFMVQSNTGNVGWGATNTTIGFAITSKNRGTNMTGDGSTAVTTGRIDITGGRGGSTFTNDFVTSGNGGPVFLTAGAGGATPPLATNDTSSGTGGTVGMTGGAGGSGTQIATNSSAGGNGGPIVSSGGAGGVPTGTASTNVTGGNGGSVGFSGGAAGAPAMGWLRKGGAGGGVSLNASPGQNSVRTVGGAGGSVILAAGNSGNNTTTPGNAGIPGPVTITAGNSGSAAAGGNPNPGANIVLTAGNGSTGTTNSNGGNIHLIGGSPGSGALAGDVVVGRTEAGTSRGGLMVGPALGGAVSITNVLGATLALDFPSTAAGTVSDLPITVTGVTSNNCAVALSVAWMGAAGGGSFSTFSSNDSVFVRFVNNNLVTAIDPTPFTATVVVFRIR